MTFVENGANHLVDENLIYESPIHNATSANPMAGNSASRVSFQIIRPCVPILFSVKPANPAKP